MTETEQTFKSLQDEAIGEGVRNAQKLRLAQLLGALAKQKVIKAIGTDNFRDFFGGER
jgi:hypothetical protein